MGADIIIKINNANFGKYELEVKDVDGKTTIFNTCIPFVN